MQYNPELPIVVSSDASSCGIGSVLSHRLRDGSDKPIAFASRSLSDCEKKYAQLEKEALALIFGIAQFHKYLYGREFLLQTDHMPLLGHLKEDRTISAMASARIQRWALTLSNYQYILEYKPGPSIGHADALSRLPLPDVATQVPVPEEIVLALSTMDETLITADKIANWTAKDPVLSQVRQFVEQGWPVHIDYAGPFEGRMILIIVDAHSKYIDAHVVSSATAGVTITKLR